MYERGKEVRLDAQFTIGTEAANVINVAVQLIDWDNNNPVDEQLSVEWYLSSDANGNALASAPSVGIAIGTDGLLMEHISNQAGTMVCEADGDIDVDIEDAGTPTMYLVLIMPDGRLAISGAITFA